MYSSLFAQPHTTSSPQTHHQQHFFPNKARTTMSIPAADIICSSILTRTQCVSKYVSSLSLSNELHRKSCGRFVIFCRKMINARHSCGICQTLKNPTLPLKRTPWSTKIIHSHIFSSMCYATGSVETNIEYFLPNIDICVQYFLTIMRTSSKAYKGQMNKHKSKTLF